MLNDRIRVQYMDPDLPGLVRSHPGIAFAKRAMPTMKGTVQETTTGPKSGLKDVKSAEIKHKCCPPLVHKECGSATDGGSAIRIRT